MRNTQRVALGGLLTAFSTALLMATNIIPAGYYTLAAAAGIIIYILSFTAGRRYGWASYLITAVLSFVLCTGKEASLCFIMLLGYYPLLKDLLERLKPRLLVWLLKLAVFNAAAVGMYFLLILVFSVPADNFVFFDIDLPVLFLLLVNPVFIIYDYAITVFIRAYGPKINRFVTKMNKRF